MADLIEKTVFGLAIALVLGCQSKADDQPYSPPPAQYAAEYRGSDDTAALMAAKQREADDAVREMLKAYEQEDFDWVRGDAEAYK
ncbi:MULTISPECIES: hypothetical protein [unclassified Neisseria]|uniref:hypothetical protein n=1 Tax=unclassified Neisseria TaxID=2623750 RepID=UPI00107281E7|nr:MULTISPECIES: hypothetical protein [unclassified Neisseria]MBF0802925.1 hypothetical protein [Neisseria sp. 19428wB4_WF04]TFU44456.1 hypothetical protein E4T99_00835 [Neisseria sp. WF04]